MSNGDDAAGRVLGLLDHLTQKFDGGSADEEDGRSTEEVKEAHRTRRKRLRVGIVTLALLAAVYLCWTAFVLAASGLFHLVAVFHSAVGHSHAYAPNRLSVYVSQRDIRQGTYTHVEQALDERLREGDSRLCGLAGPSVGHLVQVLRLQGGEVLYNPTVVEVYGGSREMLESTDLCGNGTRDFKAHRYPDVRVAFHQPGLGVRAETTFTGADAQCIQHYREVMSGEWNC